MISVKFMLAISIFICIFRFVANVGSIITIVLFHCNINEISACCQNVSINVNAFTVDKNTLHFGFIGNRS